MEHTAEDRKKFAKIRPERVQGAMDLPFLLIVILLTSVGLIMMFSASYAAAYYYEGNSTHFLVKQGTVAIAGIVIALVISRINYQYFRVLSLPALAVSIVLLVLVLIIGRSGGGAQRWIYIGPLSIQPSEVAKLGVIMSFAYLISAFREKMRTLKYGILPFVTILGVICLLMYFQPHISGMILIVAIGGALMFVGGVHWGWFLGLAVVGAAGAWFVMNNMAHSITRLEIWHDPWSDASGAGYQTVQSLYAVGSGGLFGLGLGCSRQKYLYLPEQHNDFVFAIVCEELGMVGACIVLLLFALLIIRGYWIALKARDRFGSLLVTGITTLFALQTFLNVAVVTNLIPVTGVSLPFFSYGGSSLLLNLAEMGIVLSVSRQTPAKKAG